MTAGSSVYPCISIDRVKHIAQSDLQYSLYEVSTLTNFYKKMKILFLNLVKNKDLSMCILSLSYCCFVVYNYLSYVTCGLWVIDSRDWRIQLCVLLLNVSFFFGSHFRQNTHAIKELRVQCLKYRVTLSNLWHCYHDGSCVPNFLLSAARSLFQQVFLLLHSLWLILMTDISSF